ncbi:MAG: NAD-dependent epimerase/dehydratase family protein [Bacteroidales bacterium]|nr:NAD-dependent epimerase/dehydratase family protein [Bacteroidales bacterium]
MNIVITGTAGFIGFHLTKLLQQQEHLILCIDNINNYYDTQLKYNRLLDIGFKKEDIQEETLIKSHTYPNLLFLKCSIENKHILSYIKNFAPDIIIHLAAQAGVRYSFENPYTYISSNIEAFLNILEYCRFNPVKHLIYASSSSVYGLNKEIPFTESQMVDFPASLYAASKKSNELMAHTYSYLFDIPTTGLRFFTVYGPWGRPDMALFKFTKNILENKPIDVYNHGNMYRDFTYIDDIVKAIALLINKPPQKNNSNKTPAPYQLFNIGNGSPVKLMDFVAAIENELQLKAHINYLPLQPGDVVSTHADTTALYKLLNFKPFTPIQFGIKKFIEWYRWYYKV